MPAVHVALMALLLLPLAEFGGGGRRGQPQGIAGPRDAAPAGGVQGVVRDALTGASAAAGGLPAVLVWEETDEPYCYLAALSGDGFRWRRTGCTPGGHPVSHP